MEKTLKVKKLNPNAKLPTKANKTDAGFDLYSLEDIDIPSLFYILIQYIQCNVFSNLIGYRANISDVFSTKIKTGISLEIPEGYYGLILDRSSMGSKLLKTLGGVIDCGYRGDVTVCLMNLSFFSYRVKTGDKIAQIVINKVEFDDIEEVKELAESERGEKGFGSSGQ
jgi:dUTP pyrophosphatase